jgi:hypothetical protein
MPACSAQGNALQNLTIANAQRLATAAFAQEPALKPSFRKWCQQWCYGVARLAIFAVLLAAVLAIIGLWAFSGDK